MLKLNDTKYSNMIVPNASQSDLEAGRRFIVPILSPEDDLTAIVRRVWELANAAGASIQFLGLCKDALYESSLRRSLATISAMANTGNVSADFEILFGNDWAQAVNSCARSGDTVVYWQGQQTGLLQAELNIPIQIITGIHSENKPRSNWFSQVAAWTGSVAIVVGFFFLQVKVDAAAKEWVTVLQLISLVGTVGLIWLWNSLFG